MPLSPLYLLTCAAALFAAFSLVKWLRATALAAHWRARALQRKQARDSKRASVSVEEGQSEKQVAHIISLSATQLVAAQMAGELSAVEIMEAYILRARRAGVKWNLTTEENFEAARAEAAAADAARLRGEPCGSLHGVPLSVKDQFAQAGMDSTCGMARRCFLPDAKDGLLLRLLRAEGAIPFVRTNVPQMLMVPETDNLVWGRALSPWDESRNVGGSSGGEGGLIAARASPLGLGTDIGGSVRIPAALCGISGFKCTPERTSRNGLHVPFLSDPYRGQPVVASVAGPMGRDIDDLATVMRAWWVADMWADDPTVPPLPFDDAVYSSRERLRIGVVKSDSFFPACAAAQRAVQETADALRAAGHDVVEFTPPPMEEAAQLYFSIMGATGGMQEFVAALQGEQLLPLYRKLHVLSRLPPWLRAALAAVLRAVGKKRVAGVMAVSGQKTVAQLYSRVAAKEEYKARWLSAWKEAGLQALVLPTVPLASWKHGVATDITPAVVYTFLFNLISFPAGSVHVSCVGADETEYDDGGHADLLSAAAVSDQRSSAGLPIGVQVVTLPYEDELCLRVMKEVQELVGGDELPAAAADPLLRE